MSYCHSHKVTVWGCMELHGVVWKAAWVPTTIQVQQLHGAVWDCMGDHFALRTQSHHQIICCMGPHHYSSKVAVFDYMGSIGCISDLFALIDCSAKSPFALGLPIDLLFWTLFN